MSKKRHRSRSRSRSRTKHGRRSEPGKSPSPIPHKRPRFSNEEQDSLSAILKTLQEVQQDLKHTNDRVSSMEKHWHQDVPVFPPNSSVETDSLSVMVHSEEDLVSDCEGLDTALRWLNRVMQDHEARASDLNRKLIFSFFLLFS